MAWPWVDYCSLKNRSGQKEVCCTTKSEGRQVSDGVWNSVNYCETSRHKCTDLHCLCWRCEVTYRLLCHCRSQAVLWLTWKGRLSEKPRDIRMMEAVKAMVCSIVLLDIQQRGANSFHNLANSHSLVFAAIPMACGRMSFPLAFSDRIPVLCAKPGKRQYNPWRTPNSLSPSSPSQKNFKPFSEVFSFGENWNLF